MIVASTFVTSGITAYFTPTTTSATSVTQAQCEAQGDTWTTPSVLTGGGGCNGPVTCKAEGGIWTKALPPLLAGGTCDTSVAHTFTPQEEIQSLSYLSALKGCVANNMFGKIQIQGSNNGDAAPSAWFDDNDANGLIYPSGKADCKDIATKALKLWGWSSNIDFLNAIGYTYSSKTSTWTQPSGGDSNRAPSFITAVNLKVYGKNSTSLPTLSDAANYIMALTYFQGSACMAQDLGVLSAINNPTIEGWVKANKSFSASDPAGGVKSISAKGASNLVTYTAVTVVNKDKKTEQHGYVYWSSSDIVNSGAGSSSSFDNSATLYGYHVNPTTRSCKNLASDITKYAPKYVAWLVNPSNADATVVTTSGAGEGCTVNPSATGCPPADAASSCVVDSIGWMVCPVLNALAGMTNAMYQWIQSILTLNPIQANNDDGSPTAVYTNWQNIRNIANVLMIIAFLLVIFSQLTSYGIGNYGVKKMLPRIIMVALAINLSFFLMTIIVDVVNIAGQGLYDLFNGMATNANSGTLDAGTIVGGLVSGTSGLAVAGVLGVGAAGAAGASLSTLALLAVPFILVAVLALLAAVITLFVRDALVIVLLIVAPVAIAAYLLPNTEGWFTKWRKLFASMLFLFPVAAVLFGGAKFAAYTILTSKQPMAGLIAIFIMAVPLGMLPWLARSSGGILATVGNRLQGLAKSAKAPTQRALSPFVDRSKTRYRAGETNAFGRRYSDKQLEKRAAKGKRNAAQAWQQRAMTRDNEIEANKIKATENYNEYALGAGPNTGKNGRPKGGAQRAMASLNKIDTQKLRAEKNTEARGARLDERIATAGSVEQGYANQTADYKTTRGRLQAEEGQRQADRIRFDAPNTVGAESLRGISQATYVAGEGKKAAEAIVQQANQASGAADTFIQQQKDAAFGSKVIEAEQGATFDLRSETDADLIAGSQALHEAEQQSSTSQAKVKAAREGEAAVDTTMVDLRHQQENAEAQAAGIKTAQATELKERTVTDATLAEIENNRRADEQAAKEASDELLSRYGEAVSTTGSATQVRAGGTINPEQGQAKAAAYGIDAQRSLRAENVKAAGSAITQAGYSSQQMVDQLKANKASGYTLLTPEQEEAYVRAVVATNNADRIADTVDYVTAQAGRAPIDPATGLPGEPERPSENVLALQQAFGSAIAASPSKPKFIGGAQLDQLNAGTLGATSDASADGLVVATAAANKLTKSSFGGMDIDEMKRMTRVLGGDPEKGIAGKISDLSEQQRQGLDAIVSAALTDPIVNSNFGDREIAELTQLRTILTAGLPPTPVAPTGSTEGSGPGGVILPGDPGFNNRG